MLRFVRFTAIVALILAAAAPRQQQAAAQAKPPIPAPAAAPISLSDPDGQELILEKFTAKSAIEGMLSLTELDLRFRNPQPRRIEGRFNCTLPPNAAISRFAKEINGQLMEGEVVERLRANQVYEQFLHQMRDPALLEQDQGNRFSARIFPIDPNGSVRILLSYTTLLPLENGVRRYTLPLRGLPKVGHFAFSAFITALPGEQSSDVPKSNVSGLAGASHSTAEVVSIDESDYVPPHDIELTWRPTATASRARLLSAGDFYLAAFRPDFPMPPAPGAGPRSWTFYVDTSASSAEGSEHRIHALETLFASMPPEDRVQLVAFDQEIAPLASGSAADLARRAGNLLRARLFLGGTDLGALFRDIAKNANEHPDRSVVVASDLVPTLGGVESNEIAAAIRDIPTRVTVHALILGSRQDAATAKALTAGRGRIVSIPFSESMDERARAAAEMLRRPLGASFDVTDDAAEWVYPTHFDDVRNGDELIVLGRVKPATMPHPHLHGAATAEASPQSLAAATFGPLLQREAYRAYLAYLGEREANERDPAVRSALATEQVKVSVEQRVVIPRTTLLVLESEWDYQRFGIDRRALASILTIDSGGIGVLDRRTQIAQIPQQQPRPIPPPMPIPRPVEEKAERAQPAGVAGGVVGGAAPANVTQVELERLPAADAVAQNAPVVVTAEAPRLDVRSAGTAENITSASAPPPPVAPAAPDLARRREEPRDEKKSDVAWIHPRRPTQDDVSRLQAKLAEDPRDRGTYNALSDALLAREEWPAARKLALQWQPFDPENPQVYEVLGIADEHLGNMGEAARADASLIEIAPAKPELLQRAGLLLLRSGHANLAETPLRRALQLRPDRVNSYRHLALMLWREGRIEEAARVLESATRQQFPQWYGDAQRVIREELGYVYRAWLTKEPSRRADVEQRARDYDVDLARRDALRITMAWETDANDVDLHVVDPRGEECWYNHKQTASGLELYQDITQGLGPEVIRSEKLDRGTYHVGVTYFNAGPMGISRGLVVIMRADDVQIVPFRLIEGNRSEVRKVAEVTVK